MVGERGALAEAMGIVSKLLLCARTWSAGGEVDLASLAIWRSDLLADNHRRHVDQIPAYARLTADLGVSADGGSDGDRLLLSDEWFKGYDPAWPDGDLPSLTAWLADVSTVRPSHPAGVVDLMSWRSALRAADVFVTLSSGTSGSRSLVPRDRMTLTVLRSGSGVRLPWAQPAGAFDALLLTPRGMGTGIQSGASGMAHAARRSTHDDDPDLASFVAATVADAQPLVLYGSPVRLASLLSRLDHPMPLSPGSCVVTGGGWKGASGGDVFDLLQTAAETFALPLDRCLDTYSTAELNTVLLSCAARRYHVPPVIEAVIVDDRLRPVAGDADGRLAMLEPLAMSYPGRLTTSDVVRLRHDPCPCGLQGQTLLAGIERMPGAAARGCGVTDRVDA